MAMTAQAVKRSGQHVTPNRGVHRPHPKRGLGDAFSDAIAGGMTRYVPGGVGILAIGIPACSVVSFLHFVLGMPLTVTVIVSGLTSIAHYLKRFGAG